MDTRIAAWVVTCALATGASPAFAQDIPPEASPEVVAVAPASELATEPAASEMQLVTPPGGGPVEPATVEPASVEPASVEPAATPAPPVDEGEAAAPPAPPAAEPFPIRATGILQAMVLGTQAVQSFSWPTVVAATAAANPALVPDDAAYLSFQVQQTRVGLIAGEGTAVRAQLEIDFVHFDQSSPTVQAYPRLRIAMLEWNAAEGHRLFVGQGWDLFAPLNAHTANLVGNLFQAGNSGFMRHQLGWIGRFGDVELGVVAGFQGSNAGPSFNNVEESFTPTGAMRVAYHLGGGTWLGANAIGSSLRFENGGNEERRAAYGGNLFVEINAGPLNLRAEAYVAQNLANMGVLTLGAARAGVDVADAGGWVSGRLTFGQHVVYAMAGGAAALDPDQLVPGYTPATETSSAAVNPAAGPGLEWNVAVRAGYSFSPLRGVQIIVEPYLYATRHHLAAADAALDPERVALGAQLGGQYSF